MNVHNPNQYSYLHYSLRFGDCLRVACKNVAETTKFPSQLKEVVNAIALPFVAAGKISESITHVTGPKLKEYAQTYPINPIVATYLK